MTRRFRTRWVVVAFVVVSVAITTFLLVRQIGDDQAPTQEDGTIQVGPAFATGPMVTASLRR